MEGRDLVQEEKNKRGVRERGLLPSRKRTK